MSMSIDVRSADRAPGTPARLVAPSPCPVAAPETVVDVLFPLVDDEEWPPYPAETIDAVLIAHDLAEIRGIPWFVTERQLR